MKAGRSGLSRGGRIIFPAAGFERREGSKRAKTGAKTASHAKKVSLTVCFVVLYKKNRARIIAKVFFIAAAIGFAL
jgi:hypothetical protein